MYIKLISPRMSLRPIDSDLKRRMSPSLGLLMLGALTPSEHRVVIEDENADKVTFDRPDLVGITVNVDNSRRAYEIADRFRAVGTRVILGGIHVSARPEEALAHADAVCVGEAEPVWGDVLHDVSNGGLKPRYEAGCAARLDETPFPRWGMLKANRYLYTNVVCATRGCPYHCEFCYNSCAYARFGHRTRAVERVVEEVRALKSRQVMFIDDNLIGDPDWARELVAALRPLKLVWHAAVSANLLAHPDLIDAMADSGCRSLFIGFESINGAAVAGANKRQNRVERYERLIEELHRRGIMVNASLVFGFDEDGPDVFRKTLDWLIRNKIETMTAHILTPYPGTELFARLEREGRIDDYDCTHYNTSEVVFQPKRISKQELRDGYLWMYRELYSMKNIVRRLPDYRGNRVPYLLFNLGYRKFGRVTAAFGRFGLMRRVALLARRLSYGIG